MKTYQACASCGSTKVVRTIEAAEVSTHERVVIRCYGCECRRASYTRKISRKGAASV